MSMSAFGPGDKFHFLNGLDQDITLYFKVKGYDSLVAEKLGGYRTLMLGVSPYVVEYMFVEEGQAINPNYKLVKLGHEHTNFIVALNPTTKQPAIYAVSDNEKAEYHRLSTEFSLITSGTYPAVRENQVVNWPFPGLKPSNIPAPADKAVQSPHIKNDLLNPLEQQVEALKNKQAEMKKAMENEAKAQGFTLRISNNSGFELVPLKSRMDAIGNIPFEGPTSGHAEFKLRDDESGRKVALFTTKSKSPHALAQTVSVTRDKEHSTLTFEISAPDYPLLGGTFHLPDHKSIFGIKSGGYGIYIEHYPRAGGVERIPAQRYGPWYKPTKA